MHGKSDFQTFYAGKPPWDIGKPQKPFVDVADQISGAVLDAGCGTGDTALFLAGRGCKVTGIDFIEEPIQQAKRKAAEQGISATFLVKDALTLKDWNCTKLSPKAGASSLLSHTGSKSGPTSRSSAMVGRRLGLWWCGEWSEVDAWHLSTQMIPTMADRLMRR